MMRRIILLVAVLAPFGAIALYRFGIIAALAPIFFSHLLLLTATIVPNCQWWGPVVRSFETDAAQVWLTIDDGPSAEHTLKILDLLGQHNAHATFFVIGERAERYPHLMTEILMRGHQIANHTFRHASGTFWCAGPRTIAREIDRCTAVLRATPERPVKFFRPPAGLTNPFVHPVLAQRRLRLIGWSARGFDTVRRDATDIAQAIERQLRPGAIILLHEGHHVERDPQFGVGCVALVLQKIAARGYRCVIPREEQLRMRAAERRRDDY